MDKMKLETYMDRDLARKLTERAAAEDRDASELVEEAVEAYLRRLRTGDSEENPVSSLLTKIQRRIDNGEAPELSEEEAMELANEEVHKYRAEHPETYLSHVNSS